jgi:hypothetical protein
MRKHRKRVLYRGFYPSNLSSNRRHCQCPTTLELGPTTTITLSANQLLGIKLATYNLKRDENRKYDQIGRRLNKLNVSPIHFAFTTVAVTLRQ